MTLAAEMRVGRTAADIRELARLAGGRDDGRMLLGHALCWMGRGTVGACVRQAVHGRGTMIEERHRIDRVGFAIDAGADWEVAADCALSPPARIVVHTHAASDGGGTLLAEIHLLALGEAAVPARRRHEPRAGSVLRQVAFSEADIDAYVALSGDDNALHVDVRAAQRAGLGGRVVHGALVASALEAAVREWAGGACPVSLSARFAGVVLAGEPLTLSVRELGIHDGSRIVRGIGSCRGELACTADLVFDAA
jgi:acyl dehydratase